VGSAFGAPTLGFSVGVAIGGALDAANKPKPNLAQLPDLRLTGSAYGTFIPQVWGSYRIGSQIIWADPRNPIKTSHQVPFDIANFTDFAPPTTSYTMSFACLLCRGPITQVSKIRAGDRVIYDVNASPQTSYTIRIYLGDETQTPDPLIVASAGSTTPAYRGDAYVVFQDLPLVDFNNSFPNPLSFDVVKADSALLASDSFNRADSGTLGVSDSGQTWQFGTVSGHVSSNQAFVTGTNGSPNWIDCATSDATFAQVTVTTGTGVGLGAGFVMGRLSDSQNYWWFGQSAFDSNFYELGKRVAGTFTTVATSSQLAVAGDVLKLTFNGATISGLVNGVSVLSTSDSFNQTATSYGFACSSLNPIDNFSAGLLVATQVALSTILTDVFLQAGLTSSQFDVSAATDKVDGFIIADRSDARSVIDPLLQAYDTYLTEVDGKIFALKRGAASVVTIPAGDLAARLVEGPESDPPMTLTIPRLSELDLPFRAELTYYGIAARNYLQSMQGATRVTKTWLQQVVTVTVPLVLDDTHARQIIEKILYRRWLERETPQFVLPPRYLYLAPGDTVLLPTPAGNLPVRIQQMDLALPGPLQITGVLDDGAVLTQSAAGGATTNPPAATVDVVDTTLIAWSGEALRISDTTSVGFYYGAGPSSAGYWPGMQLYWSRDGGSSYEAITADTDPATVGATLTALPAATTTGIWDDTNTLDINIISGSTPTSTSDSAVLSGDNAAIVGDEVIQFGTVTPLTGTTYRLSHLLRGRHGTDGRWDVHVIGERFALLDGATTKRLALDASLRGKKVLLKAVGASQAVASVTAIPLLINGDEYRCYAPCHPAGSRDGSLNLTVTFIRRDRADVGFVDGSDSPMSESVESYHCYIRSGVTKAVSGINTATSTITATAHGYSVNDQVLIRGIVGTVALNGIVVTVTATTTNTITISQDTSQMAAWVSGGLLEKIVRTISVSTPSVSYAAANQVSDWGGTQSSVLVAIMQVGKFGDGFPLLATV
jgi:hypothetical protein